MSGQLSRMEPARGPTFLHPFVPTKVTHPTEFSEFGFNLLPGFLLLSPHESLNFAAGLSNPTLSTTYMACCERPEPSLLSDTAVSFCTAWLNLTATAKPTTRVASLPYWYRDPYELWPSHLGSNSAKCLYHHGPGNLRPVVGSQLETKSSPWWMR